MNRMYFKVFLMLVLLSVPGRLMAQVDSITPKFQLSGYAEIFYCYDFNKPPDHNRPSFIYSHNRHNEFNLNLGFIKAGYNINILRAAFAIASGTYMNANYAAETGVLQNLYEANIGIKLSKQKSLWMDAGVFASHIGFESAVSKDCRGLTRSMLADNSPYYESGVKITYISDNSHWLFSGMVLNGWQHIERPEGNNTPAFGTQVTYTKGPGFILNYSTFIGNDKADTISQMRYFNNIYGIFHVTEKLHCTAGFDFGVEQRSAKSSQYNSWYSPVIIISYLLNDLWSVSGRGEYYADDNGVIIKTDTVHGFLTAGYSLNVDYKISSNT